MICRNVPVGLRSVAAWPAGVGGGCWEKAETQPRSNRIAPRVDFAIASPLLSFPGFPGCSVSVEHRSRINQTQRASNEPERLLDGGRNKP